MSKIINTVIPARMACSREKMGYTQYELANKIAQYLKKDNFPKASISLWETGNRSVPNKYVGVLSAVLNVSVNYLLGLSDDEKGENVVADSFEDESKKYEISFSSLFRYHNKPLFVEFLNKSYEDAWGIYDKDKSHIVFKDAILKITNESKNNIKLFTMQPFETEPIAIFKRPLDMNKVFERDNFYVRMNTTNPYICGKYNGWYHHNEDMSAMINETGLVLPYSGIGINYNIYSAGERAPVLKKLNKKNESEILSTES